MSLPKKLKFPSILIAALFLISSIFLFSCGKTKKEFSFTFQETEIINSDEVNNPEQVIDLVLNPGTGEIALLRQEADKFTLEQITLAKEHLKSKPYKAITEMLYGKNKLFFIAQNDDGKWIVVEDFEEKGNPYENIAKLKVSNDDEVYYFAERSGLDFILKNYNEYKTFPEILDYAISPSGDKYILTVYENGDWLLVDMFNNKLGSYSYLSRPKYFHEDYWGLIAREKDTNKWISIINNEKTDLFLEPLEVSHFTKSKDGDFAFSMLKSSNLWILVFPSGEPSQEYGLVKEVVFDEGNELYYIVLPREQGKLFEIRQRTKEKLLVENLIYPEDLIVLEGNVIYKTKTPGGSWEIYMNSQNLTNKGFKRVSKMFLNDENKLTFAAEYKNGVIALFEVQFIKQS